jgi:hypothetical protein
MILQKLYVIKKSLRRGLGFGAKKGFCIMKMMLGVMSVVTFMGWGLFSQV